MNQLETLGIISEAKGSKPREVLVKREEELEERLIRLQIRS